MEYRRTTDEDAYAEKYRQQRGPGVYQYSSPYPTEHMAFPMDAWIRPQFSGASLSTKYQPVDVETDLRGLGRPLSTAPASAKTFAMDSSVGNGTHHSPDTPVRVETKQTVDVPHLRTTHQRLTDPALALKGETPNRFDPVLFHNPAEHAFPTFDREVSTRIVSKDQWRLPAQSLNRLKLMTHQFGTEPSIRPVFNTSTCPKEQRKMTQEYMKKSADHIPPRPCD